MCPYNGSYGDKFGLGAFGCGGKRPVGRALLVGAAAACDGRCMKANVGIAANVGDESDDSGDLGLNGGGGAGFIITSGAIPPRFIFFGAVLEGLTVVEMGDVGDRGCVPRIPDTSTPSSLMMMLWTVRVCARRILLTSRDLVGDCLSHGPYSIF